MTSATHQGHGGLLNVVVVVVVAVVIPIIDGDKTRLEEEMLNVSVPADVWSPKVLAIVAAPVVAFVAWKVTGSLLRSFFVGRFTVMKDLPNVGKARPDNERIRGTAVICGGR